MSALLWICGAVFLILAWLGIGSSGEMKARGDSGHRVLSIFSAFMLVLGVLCWRFV
jgi:hypothetical protein